jgi:predicted nuclease of restriction endonuclease-like (RecB) superfamily
MTEQKTYIHFVQQLKEQILQSRFQAAKLVNRELLLLYYSIGKMISEKIKKEKWGNAIIDTLSKDIQNELPGLRGFSPKNLRNMRLFYEAYKQKEIWQSSTAKLNNDQNGPSSTAQIEYNNEHNKQQTVKTKSKKLPAIIQINHEFIDQIFTALSFTHHILLLNKCKSVNERRFYMEQSVMHHWTVNLLQHHIESNLYHQKGKLLNNFKATLPTHLAAHALDVFKDEYLLDFININPEDDERVLEQQIVNNIKQFILSLGTGFTFIGNQHRLIVEGEESFVDLLFFNRILQCLVAIDLKRGKFKPEYAGKMNFYLNVLDDKVKLPHENPGIGIIMCKEKNNTIVEYAFKTIDKAMGVATYKTSKQLPGAFKKVLPEAEELKKLLSS